MTLALTIGLLLVLAVGAVAFFGTRRQAVAFVLVAAAAFPLPMAALGSAAPWIPSGGPLTVLGARIDVDKAIYVMIDGPGGGGEPRLYVLPYSEQAASKLQKAMDGTADGEGTVTMEMGADGTPGFAEETPPPEKPKAQNETAIIGGL
ncbi:MAG: hypothetical protein H5U22_06305 [Rhizobium sp.]|nr:hypothetical protein [Rhizobium sp.]